MRVEKIIAELERRLENCKNKFFPYADLNMKNGDEVTIEAPSKWKWGTKDYTILTDNNEVIHCSTLESVANWIVENY